MPELKMLRERMLSALDRQLVTVEGLATLAQIDADRLRRLFESAQPAGWSAADSYQLGQALAGLEEHGFCLPPAVARRLALKLRDGQLILFAGAGLSHLCQPVAEDGARLPLWRGLAERVAASFADEPVLPDDFATLPDFFDYLKTLPHGQARVELALRNALDDRQVTLSPAHHILGQLPWSEIWTTNYDSLLERASCRVTVDGEREFFHIREHEQARVRFVLHLHGTLTNPHTLGTLDYRDWERANPKLLAYLRERLLNRTILFAGYGLGDPNLDHVLSWLRSVAHGSQVSMYGLFWHMAQARLRQLELRDRIEAVSLTREEQWHMAFSQIATHWRGLAVPAPESAPAPAVHETRAAYGRALEPDVRHALVHALHDRDENVRRAAIQAIHHLTGQWGLLEQLLGALADPDAGVRVGAAAALRQLARHAALARAVPAAPHDPQAQAGLRDCLRALAVNAPVMAVLLGALGEGQVRGPLAQALREAALSGELRAGLLALLQDGAISASLRCTAMAALCVCEREMRLAGLVGEGGVAATTIICG